MDSGIPADIYFPAGSTTAPSAQVVQDDRKPVEFTNLLNMNSTADGAALSEKEGIRQKAISEAAQAYSAQTAYCYRLHQIGLRLDQKKNALDSLFDFSALLLNGSRVQPPVIQEVDGSFKLENDNLASTTTKTWRILEPAKIVAAAPNWRAYLNTECTKPLQPNPVLMPKSAQDEKSWKTGVKEGWPMGVSQADTSFEMNMNRLKRDYKGMLNFFVLAKNGVVSTPILATGDVGIRADGNMLSVGQRVFRLTDTGKFNPSKDWKVSVPTQAAIPMANDQ